MKEKNEYIEMLDKLKSKIFDLECINREYFLKWLNEKGNKEWYDFLLNDNREKIDDLKELRSILEWKMLNVMYFEDENIWD